MCPSGSAGSSVGVSVVLVLFEGRRARAWLGRSSRGVSLFLVRGFAWGFWVWVAGGRLRGGQHWRGARGEASLCLARSGAPGVVSGECLCGGQCLVGVWEWRARALPRLGGKAAPFGRPVLVVLVVCWCREGCQGVSSWGAALRGRFRCGVLVPFFFFAQTQWQGGSSGCFGEPVWWIQWVGGVLVTPGVPGGTFVDGRLG